MKRLKIHFGRCLHFSPHLLHKRLTRNSLVVWSHKMYKKFFFLNLLNFTVQDSKLWNSSLWKSKRCSFNGIIFFKHHQKRNKMFLLLIYKFPVGSSYLTSEAPLNKACNQWSLLVTFFLSKYLNMRSIKPVYFWSWPKSRK